jgi:hypothetical protein
MDAVEVDRVRMAAGVDEADAQEVALARSQRRARHAGVVRPGGVLDARNDLDLLVGRDELPLAKRSAVRKPARLAPVEVAQDA